MHAAPVVARRLLSSCHTTSAFRLWRRLPVSLHRRAQLQHYSSTPPRGDDHVQIANVSEADINAARAHCSALLRKYDAPSYTLLAFIPRPAQSAYLSLRALNVSLALIGDSTSAPAVGALRMQFWRDAVTRALALTPPKEPVAILLAHAAASLAARTQQQQHPARLSATWLQRLINEREKHLPNPPLPTLAALETYAEHTYSTLLYLTLSALPLASLPADHVASHIGKAQGIVAVLRGLPLLAFPPPTPPNNARANAAAQLTSAPARPAITLPLDVMAAARLRDDDLLRLGPAAPGLRDAVFAVATRAHDHLITAREMLRSLRAGAGAGHAFEHAADPAHQHHGAEAEALDGGAADVERAFGVFMPAVATQLWLDRLQRCDFDVFDASLRRADWRLPWKAYWAYSRRTF